LISYTDILFSVNPTPVSDCLLLSPWICNNRGMSDVPPSRSIFCGGVYWVEVDPGEQVTPNYRHPHVVIQADVLNRSRIHTVVVCALSSNLNRAHEPGNVRLTDGEGNLPKPSVVIVSQISSIAKTQLGDHIGTLSPQRVAEILQGLDFLQKTYFER
jgi:mRNA interferase MazF